VYGNPGQAIVVQHAVQAFQHVELWYVF
jgi:hypothetical protein